MDINIKDINQYASSNRIRISVSGFVLTVIATCSFGVMICMQGIHTELHKSNELYKQQLDVAKQQYKLDSLRFEYMKNHEKTK